MVPRPFAAALVAVSLPMTPGIAGDRTVHTTAPGIVMFTKLDSATLVLDLPDGVALRPGTARLVLVSRGTGRTAHERAFPLVPAARPATLPGGGSRIVLSPGEAQTADFMAFAQEGRRLSGQSRTSITPRFGLCRTKSLSDAAPVVVSGQVSIESLPAMQPTRVDLRDLARKNGQTLDAEVEPC